jgi:hypothetical protein
VGGVGGNYWLDPELPIEHHHLKAFGVWKTEGIRALSGCLDTLFVDQNNSLCSLFLLKSPAMVSI